MSWPPEWLLPVMIGCIFGINIWLVWFLDRRLSIQERQYRIVLGRLNELTGRSADDASPIATSDDTSKLL